MYPKYKWIHFIPKYTVTREMLRENRALRRFLLIKRLLYAFNLLVPVAVLILLLTGVM